MTVGIYTKSVNNFIETLAYFISLDDRNRILLISGTQNNAGLSRNPWCLERLKKANVVEVISPDGTPRKLDWFYLHMSGSYFLWNGKLNSWLRKAKNIGCLRESHYGESWKKVLKESICSFPYYFFASSIVLQDSRFLRHPYVFIKNKYFCAI